MILDALKSDDLAMAIACVGTHEAMHRALSRRPEIKAVREALRSQAIDDGDIIAFARELLSELSIGSPLPHWEALAALAVAVERRPTEDAEEFIKSLAELRLAETAMCSGVARVCLKMRREMTCTDAARFSLETST